jgi:peptidoglycan/xylan/chitin deacetylase (PgdA/CDA1 family)
MKTGTPPRRIVVFAGSPHSPAMIEHVEAVADAFPHWQVIVVQQDEQRRPWLQVVKARIRRLTREPVSYPLEVTEQVGQRLRPRARKASRAAVALPETFDAIDRPNVSAWLCNSLHDPDTLEKLRNLNPWLGVAIGAPILKRDLYTIPQRGTVNLHKSLLPEYRGLPPGFWELYDGVDRSGVTVHWVEDGLDTGAIVSQTEVPIASYATPGGLAAELDQAGNEVLLDALKKFERDDVVSVPQNGRGAPANRRPPWRLARAVQRRLARRRRPERNAVRAVRSLFKQAVMLGYVLAWAPLRNRVRASRGRCHATVLLYHRVSDEYLDSITVGVEQFKRQIDRLRSDYDVIDLQTFLAHRDRPRRRPTVVITFDDGYADNYTAAMLLRRAGLPATFFLSTAIIGNGKAFPHDLEQLGRPVATLSWSQVRRMADWGFEFGNHTANHARLGAIPLADAVAELREAENDLDRELGRGVHRRCVAYPYGGRADITDEVRDFFRAEGIDCCLSACGGVNPPDFNPLNVRRQGIDAGFSDLAFRAAVEGWKCRV